MLIDIRTYYLSFLKAIHKKDLIHFMSSDKSSLSKVLSSSKLKAKMLNRKIIEEINDHFTVNRKYKSTRTKNLVRLLKFYNDQNLDDTIRLMKKEIDELNRNVFFNYTYHLTLIDLIRYRKLKKAQSMIELYNQKDLKKSLWIYYKIAQFSLELTQSNLSSAKEHLKELNTSDWQDFYVFLNMIYFIYKEDYKKSWLHAQEIKETDCPINLQLARLICSFELKETKYLHKSIAALVKIKSKDPYVAIILQFLQKLEKENKSLSIREINKLRIKIDDYFYDSEQPIKHLEFTPFYDWINAKTKGK